MHEVTQQDVSTQHPEFKDSVATNNGTRPWQFHGAARERMPRAKLQARVQEMRDLFAPARMQVRGQPGEDSLFILISQWLFSSYKTTSTPTLAFA